MLRVDKSKAMVVDLEQVGIPDTLRPSEVNLNFTGVHSLTGETRDIRHPNRPPSPVRVWLYGPESPLAAAEPNCVLLRVILPSI